ncbi:MAG TPA: hypothetical protein VNN10_10095 [Dehalococcoidia bacterium]|nr:hypothetical protein [Dehalococcoidia bacterium]
MDFATPVAVAVITLAALLARLALVTSTDFPLGDGGLFYAMVEDLRANRFSLPAFTSYNDSEIPFAYSPLSFYVAAAMGSIGVSTLDSLRFLPLTVGAAAIPAFYLFAKAVHMKGSTALIATSLFAFATSFGWTILGGGLTRTFGIFFGLLAMYHLYVLTSRDGSLKRVMLAGAFVALTLLSHQQLAWTVSVAFGLMLVALTPRFSWRSLGPPFAVTIIVLALTAPWWLSVISTHGTGPFRAEFAAGSFSPLRAVVGIVSLVVARRSFPLAFLIALLYLEGRSLEYAWIFGLSLVTGSLLADTWALASRRRGPGGGGLRGRPAAMAGLAMLTIVWLIPAWSAVEISHSRAGAHRPAFEWVSANTPDGSRFIVIGDGRHWSVDFAGEWFPVLARRENVATVQGSEWLRGSEGFHSRVDRHREMQRCKVLSVECLDEWQRSAPASFSHVLIDTGSCCLRLRKSLETSGKYRLVYEGKHEQIYEVASDQNPRLRAISE